MCACVRVTCMCVCVCVRVCDACVNRETLLLSWESFLMTPCGGSESGREHRQLHPPPLLLLPRTPCWIHTELNRSSSVLVCVCVCDKDREKKTDRKRDRERDCASVKEQTGLGMI